MNRILSIPLLLSAMLFFTCPGVGAEALPGVSASAYVLYCAGNGATLCSRNEHSRMKMASTTKIMTSLLCLEQSGVSDRLVKFTEQMAAEGSSMYLQLNDEVRLTDLAAGMMMASGNDAANAAAIAVSGSYDKFAELMNSRAKQIGMSDTNFVTPSGLDDDNHYSSAHDMAVLMTYAMDNPDFAAMTAKKSITVSFAKPADKKQTYSNHNRLLSSYEYCIGGKTGFTEAAGRCLVTCAEKDGLRLVCVTLDASDDWNDHKKLYDYGFETLSAVDCSDSDNSYTVGVAGSQTQSITVGAKKTVTAVVPFGQSDNIVTTVYLPPFLYAPIAKGDVVGRIVYTLDGEIIAENDLTADCAAALQIRIGFWQRLKNIFI